MSIIILHNNQRTDTVLLMAKKPNRDPKSRALQQEGSLHPHPQQVTDELFLTHEFFDPRDLVQVKYEMLRRVQSEGEAVSHSAAHFGFPRSARFCPPGTAARFLPSSGSSGFPRPTKVWHRRSSPQPRTRLDPQSKKTAVNEDPPQPIPQQEWVTRYEQLRSDARSQGHGTSNGFGLTLFLRQGRVAWMRAGCRAVTPPTREFVPPGPLSSLPCDVRTQAVLILTGILLGNRSEANPCKPTCKS
jgi:hypothetical protein